MQKIAFNVVLLPPEDLTNKIIKLNYSLKKNYSNPRIILDKETCLPHISLLMGTTQIKYLSKIKSKLEYITQNFKGVDLEITNLHLADLPVKNGNIKISSLELGQSQSLKELHENLIEDIKIYLDKNEMIKEMMYNPSEINPEDSPWMFPYILNFIINSSYDRFNPHITIGDGVLEQKLSFPISFTASKLALSHLGNYCTCRKIFYDTNPKN